LSRVREVANGRGADDYHRVNIALSPLSLFDAITEAFSNKYTIKPFKLLIFFVLGTDTILQLGAEITLDSEFAITFDRRIDVEVSSRSKYVSKKVKTILANCSRHRDVALVTPTPRNLVLKVMMTSNYYDKLTIVKINGIGVFDFLKAIHASLVYIPTPQKFSNSVDLCQVYFVSEEDSFNEALAVLIDFMSLTPGMELFEHFTFCLTTLPGSSSIGIPVVEVELNIPDIDVLGNARKLDDCGESSSMSKRRRFPESEVLANPISSIPPFPYASSLLPARVDRFDSFDPFAVDPPQAYASASMRPARAIDFNDPVNPASAPFLSDFLDPVPHDFTQHENVVGLCRRFALATLQDSSVAAATGMMHPRPASIDTRQLLAFPSARVASASRSTSNQEFKAPSLPASSASASTSNNNMSSPHHESENAGMMQPPPELTQDWFYCYCTASVCSCMHTPRDKTS